jgi:hypothetical protein
MPEVQVHRRLVKSPPELWAELSDVEGLARHLGEFGEIRITRTDPETTVAWEGERARGTVEIEPSGWGTKVTLTAETVGGTEAVTEQAKPDPVRAAASVAKDVRPAIAQPVPKPGAQPDRHPVAKRIATPGAELIAKQSPERAAEPGPEPTAKPCAQPVAKPNPEVVAKPDPKPVAKTGPAPVAKPAPLAEESAAEAVPKPRPAKGEPPAPPAPVPTPVAAPPKKLGLFARLFRRRKHTPPDAWEPDPVPAPITEEKPKAEPMREPAAEPKLEPAIEPGPAADAKPEPAVEPEPEPEAEETPAPSPTPEPEADQTPGPGLTPDSEGERDTRWVVNADPERLANRDPIVEPQAKPEPAVQADVPEIEPVVTDERAIAVLTAALDALGSAHHRPFSRG